MSNELIGLTMIVAMIFAIFIGFPISFTLLFLAIVFGYWGFGELVFYLMTLTFNSTMMEQTLTSVPLFVFMGIMMEQANLMERLFSSIQKLMSRTRGSLFYAVMFVATIFAAATGIVGASVTILGIMAGKPMIRSGYDVKLSAGLITAGGTLGILIPPSVMLIVMGPVLEVPVPELFAAAIIPGLMLAAIFTVYALVRCWLDPSLGPPLPQDLRPSNLADAWKDLFAGMVPPTVLVLFSLGSIFSGWATPTEGAACGAIGSVILTAVYGRLSRAVIFDTLMKTLEISVLILFLVAASNLFGAVFAKLGTPTMLTDYLLSLNVDRWVMLAAVLGLLFVLGWPLEWVPIVLIVVPFLLPMVTKLGFDLTWFGILVAVTLQTAWLSPPVALSAYFLKGVVPEWELNDIYRGMMQFMALQLLAVGLIAAFPQLALWLPGLWYGAAAK
jgi:tripartite ATP-independent transporter DctM subunit